MKNLILQLALLFAPVLVFGQIKSVSFSPSKNQINAGLPLPSEEGFYISGMIPQGVRLVEIKVYRSRKSNINSPTYTWKAAYQSLPKEYEVLISDPLRSNENYTLEFYYYRNTDSTEMNSLKEAIHNNLEAYIKANYEVNRKGLEALSAQKVMFNQLNQIVLQGIANYTNQLEQDFIGFSDVVRQKIDQTHSLRLRNAKFNVLRRNKEELSTDRGLYAEQLIEELINLTKAETEQYLRSNMLMLVDIRKIENYPTEKKPYHLPINVGYAGVYFKGGFNDLDYGTSPFVGMSFPLGNRTFTKFLGNASISTGVFFNNLNNGDQIEISGPLIGRPSYVGLGYTLFRIIRFNVGGAITSSEVNGNVENITIYPFIGFSAEFNLWLGLKR
ncbi:MAG: hypothetical protein WDZ72_12025 [Cyclobacteriaceae bacterium]